MATQSPQDNSTGLSHLDAVLVEAMQSARNHGYSDEEIAEHLERYAAELGNHHDHPAPQVAPLND